jgi:hypothetical protein
MVPNQRVVSVILSFLFWPRGLSLLLRFSCVCSVRVGIRRWCSRCGRWLFGPRAIFSFSPIVFLSMFLWNCSSIMFRTLSRPFFVRVIRFVSILGEGLILLLIIAFSKFINVWLVSLFRSKFYRLVPLFFSSIPITFMIIIF